MSATQSGRGRPVDQQLWDRRQSEILEMAATLFAERGFDRADTQELADRLGVAKGTLYRYFPSKRELFLAAADLVMCRLREHVDAAVAAHPDPLDQVAAAIEAFLSFFDEHPRYAELLIQERALFRDRVQPTYIEYRDRSLGHWRRFYRALIDNGRVRDMPVERITSVVCDLVYGTMFTNHIAGRRKPLREQSDDIVDIVFHGILTPEERQRRNKHP